MKPARGMAALILSKSKPPPADDETGSSEEEQIAGGEVLDAIHSGDAGALTEALKNFITICSNSNY